MYILRLLAGKFGPICTELSLTTFSAKILTKLPIKITTKKLNATASRAKKFEINHQSLLKTILLSFLSKKL